jgi:hypothetical protein
MKSRRNHPQVPHKPQNITENVAIRGLAVSAGFCEFPAKSSARWLFLFFDSFPRWHHRSSVLKCADLVMRIMADTCLRSKCVCACVGRVHCTPTTCLVLPFMSLVALVSPVTQAPVGDRFNSYDAEGRGGLDPGEDSGFGKVSYILATPHTRQLPLTAFRVFHTQYASSRGAQLAFPTIAIGATLVMGLFISLFADKLVYLVVILTLACCGLLFANYLSK